MIKIKHFLLIILTALNYINYYKTKEEIKIFRQNIKNDMKFAINEYLHFVASKNSSVSLQDCINQSMKTYKY